MGASEPLAAAVARGDPATMSWVRGLLNRQQALLPEPMDKMFGNRDSTCRCGTGFWNNDPPLQKAFRDGYILTHTRAFCGCPAERLFTEAAVPR